MQTKDRRKQQKKQSIKSRRCNYEGYKYLKRTVEIENYELEIIEVHLKRTEYETKVVQLVKALLEIDRALNATQDQAIHQSTASEMKEAS